MWIPGSERGQTVRPQAGAVRRIRRRIIVRRKSSASKIRDTPPSCFHVKSAEKYLIRLLTYLRTKLHKL